MSNYMWAVAVCVKLCHDWIITIKIAIKFIFKNSDVLIVCAKGPMMASSNGNIFRVIGHLCGEFTGEFRTQRPVTRSFDVFFDPRLNKQLGKQSRRWWFETPSCPLWRHCNAKLLDFQWTLPATHNQLLHYSPKSCQSLPSLSTAQTLKRKCRHFD